MVELLGRHPEPKWDGYQNYESPYEPRNKEYPAELSPKLVARDLFTVHSALGVGVQDRQKRAHY
jgi:hypothetical protein